MHGQEVTYQYIQRAYQNAYRPNLKRNATVPKETFLNPTYFKNLSDFADLH